MHTLADIQSAAAELRDTVSNFVSHLVNHPDPTGSSTPETLDAIHAEIEMSTRSIVQSHNLLVVGAAAAPASEPSPAPLPFGPAEDQQDAADPAPADDSQSVADALNQKELDQLADPAPGPA